MDQARRCPDKRIWRETGRGSVYQLLTTFSLSRMLTALSLTLQASYPVTVQLALSYPCRMYGLAC